VWSLIDAFREIYERKELSYKEDILFSIETVSVEERSDQIINFIKTRKEVDFFEIFNEDKSKPQLIITFLSILELVKGGLLDIAQDSPNNKIRISYIGEE
ncbi:MAG: segregation/condensation protein A, partial [Candidatus Dadabacteria bacterium]|nr:segregation/condensation protein A [Candidatus Dadabacteria bacterium]NIQ16830.1 segregation/condensation protein A [Candidatus Dadabacteria bacterium]